MTATSPDRRTHPRVTPAADLLAHVPTQRTVRRSAHVEADDVRLDALLEGVPVRVSTLLAAALPELDPQPR